MSICYSYEFNQGEDYQFSLNFLDDLIDDGIEEYEPLDLSNFTFECLIRSPLGSVLAVGELIDISTTEGIATFKFAASETKALAGLGVLQVKVVGATSNTLYAINDNICIHSNGDSLTKQVSGSLLTPLPMVEGAVT